MKKASSTELGQCIFCVFRSQRRWIHNSAVASSRQSPARTWLVRMHYSPWEGEEDEVGEGAMLSRNKSARRETIDIDAVVPCGDVKIRYGRHGGAVTRRRPSNFADFSINMRKRMNPRAVNLLIAREVAALKKSLELSPTLKALGLDGEQFEAHFGSFEKEMLSDGLSSNPTLHDIFVAKSSTGLEKELKQRFIQLITSSKITPHTAKKQASLANLRHPAEWFPFTRTLQRKIHLHVGPTNSGKTYHALKKLEAASTGVYAGPLRLLAHEVYTRLNANGKPCLLVTGEEVRAPDGTAIYAAKRPPMTSCTVEMIPINKSLDVAVIDEIQMIGSEDRGWAWTQALLGVMAKEVHLCGEERVIPLIQYLTSLMGEELEIHHYERLSPLKSMNRSLFGQLGNLEKGDCVVVFSRRGIHSMRSEIEKVTGKKCAVIYGSLPPETRAQQARLFNDPDNDYDILVASDAIGMGLNLSIKRIIFESLNRHFGGFERPLSVWDIKQIGGRAGRYRAAGAETKSSVAATSPPAAPSTPSVGLVTTLDNSDLATVQEAMESNPDPIMTAGIFPPATILQQFAAHFPPQTPFSYILTRLHEMSQIHPRFHLCDLRDQVWSADVIEPVQDLTILDKIILCSAPVSSVNDRSSKMLVAFATCVAQQSGGDLLSIKEVPLELLDKEISLDKAYLEDLETLHKGLTLYLWLSYRFNGIFTSRPLAFHVKAMVETNIDKVLSEMDFNYEARAARKAKKNREAQELKALMEKIKGGCADGPDLQVPHSTTIVLDDNKFEFQLPADLMSELEADTRSVAAEAGR